jgi:DNA-binding transcriptional ArsR family regulator
MTIETAGTILEMPAAGDLELEHVLQALSDPVRLEIVRSLAAGGEQACGAMPLPVSASTRSHHVRILRDAGITVTRAAGTHRYVSLRRKDLDRRFPGLLDVVLRAR